MKTLISGTLPITSNAARIFIQSICDCLCFESSLRSSKYYCTRILRRKRLCMGNVPKCHDNASFQGLPSSCEAGCKPLPTKKGRFIDLGTVSLCLCFETVPCAFVNRSRRRSSSFKNGLIGRRLSGAVVAYLSFVSSSPRSPLSLLIKLFASALRVAPTEWRLNMTTR